MHYYRPDFTEAQAKQLIFDMRDDLAEFTIHDIETAIRDYRIDPKSKFFPTSGQLRKLAAEARKEQAAKANFKPMRPVHGESRPILWWMQPKSLWKAHWLESEVPYGEKIKDKTGGPLRDVMAP